MHEIIPAGVSRLTRSLGADWSLLEANCATERSASRIGNVVNGMADVNQWIGIPSKP
jgi:hypothetical protein